MSGRGRLHDFRVQDLIESGSSSVVLVLTTSYSTSVSAIWEINEPIKPLADSDWNDLNAGSPELGGENRGTGCPHKSGDGPH